MSTTKQEHFVPNFYLKKFANLALSKNENEDKYIEVFDKKEQRMFSSNTKKLAKDGRFYDFPIELFGENDKIFDKLLQRYEEIIAPFYKKFETKLSYIINLDNKQKSQIKAIKKMEKKYWSYILAIQALRTPEFRNFINEVKQKAANENITQEFLEKKSSEEIEKIKTSYPELNSAFTKDFLIETTLNIINILHDEFMPITHHNFFVNHLHDLSKIFVKHKWIVGVNQTEIPFYTSDHPIVKIPYFQTGYASDGIEILFPINSKFVLVLRDKKHPKSYEGDCKLVVLSEDEVNNYNKAQVYCSNRFIFCQKKSFELVQEICKQEPDVCSGVKDRMKFIK
ncbi:MAG TPA: DUF4238 domain-containing protein [Kamptonema sp.]|nr:DUF4238 domain-containing protein [Kamptonema sp.]